MVDEEEFAVNAGRVVCVLKLAVISTRKTLKVPAGTVRSSNPTKVIVNSPFVRIDEEFSMPTGYAMVHESPTLTSGLLSSSVIYGLLVKLVAVS